MVDVKETAGLELAVLPSDPPHQGSQRNIQSMAADDDDGVDTYKSGVTLRDLADNEVHQFPGLKREHWW
jgi:hypothetical protein